MVAILHRGTPAELASSGMETCNRVTRGGGTQWMIDLHAEHSLEYTLQDTDVSFLMESPKRISRSGTPFLSQLSMVVQYGHYC
jgi:hypothetical protein